MQKDEESKFYIEIICKVYDPEAQPWLMRVGGKGGKKYKVRVEAFLIWSLSIWGFSSLVE